MSARDRITAEALKLFVRQGVGKTTTREIAAAAAIAEGTIYRHFKSKDELAESLFIRNYLAFAGYLDRAASRATTADERLARMISWLTIAAERDGDLFSYLFLLDHGLESRLKPDDVTPLTLMRAAVAAATPEGDPELTLALVTGALFGVVRARRQGQLHRPLTEEVGRLVAAARALTQSPAAAVPVMVPSAETLNFANLSEIPAVLAVDARAEAAADRNSLARHLLVQAPSDEDVEE